MTALSSSARDPEIAAILDEAAAADIAIAIESEGP
jgi:hypothetical protein